MSQIKTIEVAVAATTVCVDNELEYNIRNGINEQRPCIKTIHLQDLSHRSASHELTKTIRMCCVCECQTILTLIWTVSSVLNWEWVNTLESFEQSTLLQ